MLIRLLIGKIIQASNDWIKKTIDRMKKHPVQSEIYKNGKQLEELFNKGAIKSKGYLFGPNGILDFSKGSKAINKLNK